MGTSTGSSQLSQPKEIRASGACAVAVLSAAAADAAQSSLKNKEVFKVCYS